MSAQAKQIITVLISGCFYGYIATHSQIAGLMFGAFGVGWMTMDIASDVFKDRS